MASSRSYRTRGLTAEIAPNSDALWINGPVELTAISSAPIIGKSADQLIAGGNKRLQGRVCACAGRLNP